MPRAAFIAWGALGLSAVATAQAPDYAARRAAAVHRCEAISPSEYQSGLLFNPDGYRSFYVQSECLQRSAVEFRDPSLCARVHRRRSLFSSSWGVSGGQCRALIAEAVAADRAELEREKRLYAIDPVRLKGFRIEPNGNGRDFDFIPEFSAGRPHGYQLKFEIVGAGVGPVLLHADGYYLDADSNLRIYVRRAEVRERFPQFSVDRSYAVRATLTYTLGTGGLSSFWSDEFVESVFPLRQRSQIVTLESSFPERPMIAAPRGHRSPDEPAAQL